MADYESGVKDLTDGIPTELGTYDAGVGSLGKYLDIQYYCNQPGVTFILQYDRSGDGSMWTEDSNNTADTSATRSHYLQHYAIYKGKLKFWALYQAPTGGSPTAKGSVEVTVGDKVYSNEERVWSTAGIGSSVIDRGDTVKAIIDATSEVDLMAGRNFNSTQVSETYYGNNKNVLILDKTPIISVDSLDVGSTSVTTSEVDVNTESGEIVLKTSAEATEFKGTSDNSRNISVTYTHGYSSVPNYVVRLSDCIAAINILAEQTGGTYNDITSFSIGGYTASLGEPYTNIRQTVSYLEKEINRLMGRIRRQPFIQ